MKIAIPVADGLLCTHFGQCQQFAVIDVDDEGKKIVKQETLTPPPHEPGSFPAWLSEMGCNLIITGGIGGRAVTLFEQNGIEVIMGTQNNEPIEIVNEYLSNNLRSGKNLCGEPGYESRKTCED